MSPATRASLLRSVSGALLTPIACSTNWSALRSSRLRGTTPASNREISRRSSTRVRKRVTSLRSRSTAARARSGISDLRLSITSMDASSVMSGERSSWLTSEAKRASRSTRCSSASAISLNDSARTPRSGSFSGFNRVSSRPPAIDFAARAASATGRTARRAANAPAITLRPRVRPPAMYSERRTLDSAESTSARLKNSKKAPLLARGHPTTM